MSVQDLIIPPEETNNNKTDIKSGSKVEPSCELSFNIFFIGFTTCNSSANNRASINTYLNTANENLLFRDNVINIIDGTS
jgi:hypothetical protein